jgi:hypothetical protein
MTRFQSLTEMFAALGLEVVARRVRGQWEGKARR